MKVAQFQYTLPVTADSNHKHTVQVTLLPSRKQFLAYCRSKSLFNTDTEAWEPISGKGCAAKLLTFSPQQVQDGDPHAEMLFYPDQFTPDSIAHEACHAVCALFRVHALTLDRDEELFAHLAGKLTQAVLQWKHQINT